MPSYLAKVVGRATTLLASKVGNNPPLTELRDLTGSAGRPKLVSSDTTATSSRAPHPGSRQRAGISVSCCDAKEGQGSAGVAGVAAQGGGDVAVAAQTQESDGQGLRRLAIARGAVPVRTWEASSAKLVSRRWCKASMPQ